MLNSEILKIDLPKKTVELSDREIKYENLISTIPLDIFLKLSGDTVFQDLKFLSTPIDIINFKVDKIVPNWLINIYVPSSKQKVYRLSLLNGTASIESVCKIDSTEFGLIKQLFNMFHLDINNPKSYTWSSGKIVSLDLDTRENILSHFANFDVFLIGRFGSWNNKLLVDSTINQAKEVCKYINMEKINKFDTDKLIHSLL